MADQARLEEPHMVLTGMTHTAKHSMDSMDSMHSMRMVLQLYNPRPPHPHMADQLGVPMEELVGLGRPWAAPLPTPMPLLLHLSLHAHW